MSDVYCKQHCGMRIGNEARGSLGMRLGRVGE